jgi:hypothetical protein
MTGSSGKSPLPLRERVPEGRVRGYVKRKKNPPPLGGGWENMTLW